MVQTGLNKALKICHTLKMRNIGFSRLKMLGEKVEIFTKVTSGHVEFMSYKLKNQINPTFNSSPPAQGSFIYRNEEGESLKSEELSMKSPEFMETKGRCHVFVFEKQSLSNHFYCFWKKRKENTCVVDVVVPRMQVQRAVAVDPR